MPEWQRSVHDGRYQYIRNLRPDVPLMRPLAFRDVLPTMKEMWRLHRARQLPASVEQYFVAPRQSEELYDLRADPDTVRNIANDPAHRSVLQRLRATYQDWTRRLGDDSARPEREMIGRIWPGLKQPQTAAPVISVGNRGVTSQLTLSSPTKGASIGYRLSAGSPWQLYTRPVPVPPGAQIEAKAIRYGYAESPLTSRTIGARP
jgi:hypothetical protein